MGGVQDEEHVIFYCEDTRDLREKHGVGGLTTLVEVLGSPDYIDFIFEIMKRFK